MKKLPVFLLILTLFVSVFLASCNGVEITNDETAPTKADVRNETYTVEYVFNNEVVKVSEYKSLSQLEYPNLDIDGYEFVNFIYLMDDGTEVYVDSDTLEELLKANKTVRLVVDLESMNNANFYNLYVNDLNVDFYSVSDDHVKGYGLNINNGELQVEYLHYDGRYYVTLNGENYAVSEDMIQPIATLFETFKYLFGPRDVEPIEYDFDNEGDEPELNTESDDEYGFDDDYDIDLPAEEPSLMEKLMSEFTQSKNFNKIMMAFSQLMYNEEFVKVASLSQYFHVEGSMFDFDNPGMKVSASAEDFAQFFTELQAILDKEEVKPLVAKLVYSFVDDTEGMEVRDLSQEEIDGVYKVVDLVLSTLSDLIKEHDLDLELSYVPRFENQSLDVKLGGFSFGFSQSKAFILPSQLLPEDYIDLDPEFQAVYDQVNAFLAKTPLDFIAEGFGDEVAENIAAFLSDTDNLKDVLVELLETPEAQDVRAVLTEFFGMTDEELQNMLFSLIKYDEVKELVEPFLDLEGEAFIDKLFEVAHIDELVPMLDAIYEENADMLTEVIFGAIHFDEVRPYLSAFANATKEEMMDLLFTTIHYDEIKTIVLGVLDLSKDDLFNLISFIVPEEYQELVSIVKDALTDEVMEMLNEELQLDMIKTVVKGVLSMSNEELFDMLANLVHLQEVQAYLRQILSFSNRELLNLAFSYGEYQFTNLIENLDKAELYNTLNEELHLDEIKSVLKNIFDTPKEELFNQLKEATNFDAIRNIANNLLSVSNEELVDVIFLTVQMDQIFMMVNEFLNMPLAGYLTLATFLLSPRY